MKKQYMDFVPAKSKPKSIDVAMPKTRGRTGGASVRTRGQAVRSSGARSGQAARATSTKVERRAVSRSVTKSVKPSARKSAKEPVAFTGEPKLGVVEDLSSKFVRTDVPKRPLSQVGTYRATNAAFVNQGKVAKRPLSKNVRAKKIVAPKEVPKGPVTIISKPEKQAHAGMIVAIILTIILGAAAGTVAFLLLPK